jgi:homoserine dehydrogenase
MAEPFRLGIAGLGTVGAGVVKIVQEHGETLAERAGRSIEIVSVNARDKNKDRGVDLSNYTWIDDAENLPDSNNIHAVVELIGGSEGPALNVTKKSLERGLNVITANKAMLAHHGFELALLAEKNEAALAYEASVAGGIPIIKTLREGFAADKVHTIYGILNGTCNYMMTAMRERGQAFDEILKEAQDLGYAEADPTFDVDGIDAGHKLCLLASLAFGTKPDFKALSITGIRKITPTDMSLASELGYKIKLLGIAKKQAGGVIQVMEPCLVPESSMMAAVENAYNAVWLEGDFLVKNLSVGMGAGQGPTATSVIADIIDVARGDKRPTFGVPANDLAAPDWMPLSEMQSQYFIRLAVKDNVGVLADVSGLLKEHGVSVEELIQHSGDEEHGQPVSIGITTHKVTRADIDKACEKLAKVDTILEEPSVIRIEGFE